MTDQIARMLERQLPPKMLVGDRTPYRYAPEYGTSAAREKSSLSAFGKHRRLEFSGRREVVVLSSAWRAFA